jgi:glycosyltransferase involved in cell wall biosynthesis
LFDEDYYIRHNPDVNASGFSAIKHFFLFGGFEGRKPSRTFETRLYSNEFPEIQERNINPLIHYFTIYDERIHRPLSEIIAESYSNWIERFEPSGNQYTAQIEKEIDLFNNRPLISVVMPVFNPRPEWLKEAIDSVRQQIYPVWELCIADDASTNPEIKEILTAYATLDSRIKVIFRPANGHICETSNSALSMVEGEYLALLDHDDMLAETALYHVAIAINNNPQCRLIYSDEDKTDGLGERFDPYFKPDWNNELLYAQNFISHLGVYHAETARSIGGFRPGYEGSQDYDLALRFIEVVEHDSIIHIPKVLYHWRIHQKSTSLVSSSKEYAYQAGLCALNEHLKKLHPGAIASPEKNNLFKVSYPKPKGNPLVSIIITNKNNNSNDLAFVTHLKEYSSYKTIETQLISGLQNENEVNYASMINKAVHNMHGEFICIMNSGLEILHSDWIEEMLSLACQVRFGAIGPRILRPDKTIFQAGLILGFEKFAKSAFAGYKGDSYDHFGRIQVRHEISVLNDLCMMVKRSKFEEIGGFNENDLPACFYDLDLCLRLDLAGYKNVYTPFAEFIFLEPGLSENPINKSSTYSSEIAYMKQHWNTYMLNDPAYNPNLSNSGEPYKLRW